MPTRKTRFTSEGGADLARHRPVGHHRRVSTPRSSDLSGAPQKWEYVTVPLLVHATKQILDGWGDQGYELVTVIPGPNPEQLVAYLKRPKS